MPVRAPRARPSQAYAAAGGRKPQAAPYIRISEQEIADDYPLPKQYNKGALGEWGGAMVSRAAC